MIRVSSLPFHAPVLRIRLALWYSGVVVGSACGGNATPDFGSVPPGLRISFETRYYDVRGSSPHDLEVQMVMHGPEVEGHPRYGATAFQIRWAFSTRTDANGCTVRSPRVELDMEAHLPRWVDGDRADSLLQGRWEAFLDAVRIHESGHQRLNVEGATRMVRALRDARSAGGCSDLRRVVEGRLRNLLGDVHADNSRYDIETGGGARSGVRWPPAR